MGPSECAKLQDITPDLRRGSLVLRNHDSLMESLPNIGLAIIDAIGEWKRSDGTKYPVVVGSPNKETSRSLYIQRPGSRWEIPFSGLQDNRKPSLLGVGYVSLQMLPEELRVYGESGLGWLGRINTLDEEDVSPRMFSQSSGDAPVLPSTYGIGYAGWDSNVYHKYHKSGGNTISDWASVEVAIGPEGDGFAGYASASYFVSFVYEGGQESIPALCRGVTVPASGAAYIDVTVTVDNIELLPYTVKLVNLYRITDANTSPILVKSFEVYNTSENYEEWDVAREHGLVRAIRTFRDYNRATIGTYMNLQGFSEDITYFSPFRGGAKVFGDRGFYWRTIEEHGRIVGNKVWFDHINGFGTLCRDIVPPYNSFSLTFQVFDIVPLYGSYAIIGDTGYAIGHLSGDVNASWSVSEAIVPIGCRSRKTIAATPYGAIFLGREGIYSISGSRAEGPLARGVLYYYEDSYDLDNAIATYSPATDRYYLVAGGNTKGGNLVISFDIRNGRIRTLSGLGKIRAIGIDSDGYAIVASGNSLIRIESPGSERITTVSKTPEYLSGHRRFVGGDSGQKVSRIKVHYSSDKKVNLSLLGKWYQKESLDFVLPAIPEGGEYVVEVPASAQFDYAHQIGMNAENPSDFQIHNIWAEVSESDTDWRV